MVELASAMTCDSSPIVLVVRANDGRQPVVGLLIYSNYEFESSCSKWSDSTMKVDAKIGGHVRANDPRASKNWVGRLNLRATKEGEQFMLAAVLRGLLGEDAVLHAAIVEVAEDCRLQHQRLEKATGVSVKL